MSSIYDINFGLAAERLSPPVRRQPLYQAWLKSLLSPLQWLRNMALGYYQNGISQVTAPFHDNDATYHYKDLVVGMDDRVYQNIYSAGVTVSDVDTDRSPTGDNGSTYWIPVLNDYIGVREKFNYNAQTMTLEAILNKRFRIDPSPENDDFFIYINNRDNDMDYNFFYNSNENYPGVLFHLNDPLDPPIPPPPDEPEEHDPIPVYFFYESEYVLPEDFMIQVPAELLEYYYARKEDVEAEEEEMDYEQLSTIIAKETNKYSIAGVKFNIEFYDSLDPYNVVYPS